MSNDTDAQETNANASKDRGNEVETTGGGAEPLALLFVVALFHVPKYNPKEDYPSLGTIYSIYFNLTMMPHQ